MIFVKNTKKISYYFSKSYISITSGGSLLNESLLFNLKRIIISTASNQVNQCKAWNKLNYIEEKEKISTKLKNKLNNVKKIKSKNYTNKEKLLNGKFRIVKKILYEINN